MDHWRHRRRQGSETCQDLSPRIMDNHQRVSHIHAASWESPTMIQQLPHRNLNDNHRWTVWDSHFNYGWHSNYIGDSQADKIYWERRQLLTTRDAWVGSQSYRHSASRRLDLSSSKAAAPATALPKSQDPALYQEDIVDDCRGFSDSENSKRFRSDDVKESLSSVTSPGKHGSRVDRCHTTCDTTQDGRQNDNPKDESFPSRLSTTWSEADDRALVRVVDKMKQTYDDPLPWSIISGSLPGSKTPASCSKRYRRLTQMQGLSTKVPVYKKGAWSAEEDEDLVATIARFKASRRIHGLPLPWTRIGAMLRCPRSGLQVCARYTEALDPSVKRGRWSREEDLQLLAVYAKLQGRWSLISQEIPGRTQRQCASRYGVLQNNKRK